jgi:hypothetical protein
MNIRADQVGREFPQKMGSYSWWREAIPVNGLNRCWITPTVINIGIGRSDIFSRRVKKNLQGEISFSG